MKFSVFLVALLTSYLSLSQDIQPLDLINPVAVTLPETCEEIIETVTKEAAQNRFTYVVYGLLAAEAMPYDESFSAHIRYKYGIQFLVMGCVVDESIRCYANANRDAIEKKYGEHFVEKEFEKFKENE